MPHPTIEIVAARLAARQHGIVTRGQLRAAGISDDVIDHRVRTGRIQRMHAGVYLVGAVAPPHARAMAACLACGPRAALSHRSAAVAWQILKARSRPTIFDVTIPGGFRRRTGVRVHRIRTLRPDEVTRLHGIPITTAARTLYDLAAQLGGRPLDRAVAEAIALKLTTAAELQAMAARRAGRRGASRLAAVFHGGSPARTRSEAEEIFLAMTHRAHLRAPEVNVTVAGIEVDFYWPRERLAVEIDGMAFHRSPRATRRDRRRDRDLAAAGIRVMRVGWRELTTEPEALLVRLGAALFSAAAPGGV